MNYFAHAVCFLDEPYFAAGTGVPDWLSVVDRGVRLRWGRVQAFLADPDPSAASLAGGILQHLRDDARFHESRAFAEVSLALGIAARDALGADTGFRPLFLGHLLAEVLLDATLVAEDPDRLKEYYGVLESLDPGAIQQAVNRMASRPSGRLAEMISRFCREQILWDYLEDARLLVRLNQVMRRTRFGELPEHFRHILPDARRLVEGRKSDLLEGVPTAAT